MIGVTGGRGVVLSDSDSVPGARIVGNGDGMGRAMFCNGDYLRSGGRAGDGTAHRIRCDAAGNVRSAARGVVWWECHNDGAARRSDCPTLPNTGPNGRRGCRTAVGRGNGATDGGSRNRHRTA